MAFKVLLAFYQIISEEYDIIIGCGVKKQKSDFYS
jgi:hypothetical protein